MMANILKKRGVRHKNNATQQKMMIIRAGNNVTPWTGTKIMYN
jgi:hypothetical protein